MSEEREEKTANSPFRRWISFFNQSAISLPMIVFAVLAVSVLSASTLYRENLQRSMEESVDRLSQESQIKTAANLEAYDLLTRGGIGLLKSSEVDNEGWNTHLRAMDLEGEYPAVQVIGYSEAIRGGDSPTDTLRLEYMYPITEQRSSLLGRDLNDLDSNLKEHIDIAVKTGTVQLSDVSVFHPLDKNNEKFLQYMLTPVYSTEGVPETEQDRIDGLQGVVFLVIDVSELFRSVYLNPNPSMSSLRVSGELDGKRSELFSWSNSQASSGIIRENQTLDIMGQTFYFDYSFSRSGLLLESQRYVAMVMPLVGLVIALLLAMLISFTLRVRSHRLSTAREREVQAAKDELLSLASHQLRTPATGVKQYLGMVLQGFAGDVPETQRDFLERAYASNERQLHIINDILYLAKLDAGRIVLTKTEYDLAELVKSVSEELAGGVSEAGITLKVDTPDKAPAIGDGHMIRMVIENLITNAIKYTNPGGEVAVKLDKGDEGRFLVSVSDTGVGIDREDIPKLFQQFVRIPNERSSQVSGTGVGLYLASSLAEMHGGEITVKSKLGEGSTFTLEIPDSL